MSSSGLSSATAAPAILGPSSTCSEVQSSQQGSETQTSATSGMEGSSSSRNSLCECPHVVRPSSGTRPSRGLHLSRNPSDLLIPVSVFCRAFPFHFLCDQELRLLQIGSGEISNNDSSFWPIFSVSFFFFSSLACLIRFSISSGLVSPFATLLLFDPACASVLFARRERSRKNESVCLILDARGFAFARDHLQSGS